MKGIRYTLSAIAIAAAGTACAQEEYTTPGFAAQVDRDLRTACPDPTPPASDPIAVITCASGLYTQAYNVAANLSTHIKENLSRNFWAGAAQGELRTCEYKAKGTEALENILSENPSPEAASAFIQSAILTAEECILSTDRAENAVGRYVDTPAQNHVIKQINCFKNPSACERPSGLTRDL